jgi:ABC-type Fe3+/spermidine/putrescine transport system ATPase subunit
MSSATFQTLRQSDQVRIAVRPEKIRISAIDDGALISGVIEEWIYLGDSTRWRVRLKDGTIVTVFEQNQSSTGDILRYFIGQTVYLSWDEHNSIIFDGDDRQ